MSLHPLEAMARSGPYSGAATVTPSDTADLTHPCSALAVTGAGALKVTMGSGTVYTFSSAVITAWIAVTPILPITVTRVWNTGTGATGIVALW